jgi:hypothetical protein
LHISADQIKVDNIITTSKLRRWHAIEKTANSRVRRTACFQQTDTVIDDIIKLVIAPVSVHKPVFMLTIRLGTAVAGATSRFALS